MQNWKDHIVPFDITIKEALAILDKQALLSNVLFVVDNQNRINGSLTDGDIRRSLLNSCDLTSKVSLAMRLNFLSIKKDEITPENIKSFKNLQVGYLPVVDDNGVIISIIKLSDFITILPIDVVLMAGGRGERLSPLTNTCPKPLLKVGEKPIIEHTIDRLKKFGIQNIYVSINYLGDQISSFFGDGTNKGLKIKYVKEKNPLGTLGSITLIENFENDVVLLLNSDILTNLDFSDFYSSFIKSNADMAVASLPFHVDIPYAILEVNELNRILSLKEKPRYTYFSNAGIYLIKKKLLEHCVKGQFCNVTDFIEILLSSNYNVITYNIVGYWKDIGRHEDYSKAQEDIQHLQL